MLAYILHGWCHNRLGTDRFCPGLIMNHPGDNDVTRGGNHFMRVSGKMRMNRRNFKTNRTLKMLIGCLVPLLAIFLLPYFGIN